MLPRKSCIRYLRSLGNQLGLSWRQVLWCLVSEFILGYDYDYVKWVVKCSTGMVDPSQIHHEESFDDDMEDY